MANATLTITADEKLIRRAEQLAAGRNISVEALVERLLYVATLPAPAKEELGPVTRSLSGILPPMSDQEVDDAVTSALMQKHGVVGRQK